MVNIADNRKIADLVVQPDEQKQEFEKINPKTLATIVSQAEKDTNVSLPLSVQDHINDTSIHLTEQDITKNLSDYLQPSNIKAGNNITVQNDGNNVTISSVTLPVDDFITLNNLVPSDETITLEKNEEDNKIEIRANIPDVSKDVKQENIKAGNNKIKVEYDKDSNDVILYGPDFIYDSGDGISIKNAIITNTLPDQIVTLEEGSNITVEGEYPNYKISSTDKIKVSNWKPNTQYQENDFVIYDNSFFQCLEAHSSAEAFDASKWKLIAGWNLNRQFFDIQEETDTIVLNTTVPNKNVLIINIDGMIVQSSSYTLEPDQQTIKFVNPIPANNLVEVTIMSNIVMDTYDSQASIRPWQPNISFAVDNICVYDNSLYQCIERHVSDVEFDKEKWKLVCGYVKNSYFFTTETETTQIELPEAIYKTSDIMINIGNTLLQSNNYTVNATGKIITFVEPIEAGATIEVIHLSNAVLQNTMIPNPYKSDQYLVSNASGNGYKTLSKDEVKEEFGIKTLTDIKNKASNLVAVNQDGTDYEFLNADRMSARMNVRNIVQGFRVSVLEKEIEPSKFNGKNRDDKLLIDTGSALDVYGKVLLHNDKLLEKNPNLPFEVGTGNGSMIGMSQDTMVLPTMTSNESATAVIRTSEAQTDREGWRAMDGLNGTGNGWLVNNTTATWQYELKNKKFTVISIKFVNTDSGVQNHSKDIDLWVNTPTNVVASFTAKNEDYGVSEVKIANPQEGNIFGLTIKNSYGQGVGMNEIVINTKLMNYLASSTNYKIYAIGNLNGTMNDIATSEYELDELLNNLPNNFDTAIQIGNFRTDKEWNIYNIYPEKDIRDSYMDGSINGSVLHMSSKGGHIKEYKLSEVSNTPHQIIEQWNTSLPVNGEIKFQIPYAVHVPFYVMANGVEVLSFDREGFKVDPSITKPISWIAKGY